MKVVIADDAPAVRDRLSALVGEIQGIEIVGTAATASEALALVETHQPNVAILDIRMPEEGGIAVLQRIKSQKLGPIVIMLTNYDDKEYRAACLSAGADLFLDKAHGLDHLVPLIRGLSKQFHALHTEITPISRPQRRFSRPASSFAKQCRQWSDCISQFAVRPMASGMSLLCLANPGTTRLNPCGIHHAFERCWVSRSMSSPMCSRVGMRSYTPTTVCESSPPSRRISIVGRLSTTSNTGC